MTTAPKPKPPPVRRTCPTCQKPPAQGSAHCRRRCTWIRCQCGTLYDQASLAQYNPNQEKP